MWALVQSPFIIDRSIVVRSSVTLTVQPGVHVIFTDPEAGIHVLGKSVL